MIYKLIHKNKRKEKKSQCFHEWCVIDFEEIVESDGTCTDFYQYYVLGCKKCGSTRRVDKFLLSQMKHISKQLVELSGDIVKTELEHSENNEKLKALVKSEQ